MTALLDVDQLRTFIAGARSRLGVNMRNTRSEYFTSSVPSITDIARTRGHFREVPILLQKSVEGHVRG
jgi:hypothetical protein